MRYFQKTPVSSTQGDNPLDAKPVPGETRIIDLMRFSGLGDVIMATAVFTELKAQGYTIRFLSHPGAEALLQHHPLVDAFVPINGFSSEVIEQALKGLPKAERYAPIGYPPWPFRRTDDWKPPVHATVHMCRDAKVKPTDELSLGLSAEQEAWGQQYENVLLIHTRTGFSPYKDWPRAYWRQLAERLRTETGLQVLQICGPKDEPLQGVDILESPTIAHVVAAIKYARLFIGLDSVFNHASRALKKRSLILWGSTHPALTGYVQNVNLMNGKIWQPGPEGDYSELACQPCYLEYKSLHKGWTLCQKLASHSEHHFPHAYHPEAVIQQCMANNTVALVCATALSMLEA